MCNITAERQDRTETTETRVIRGQHSPALKLISNSNKNQCGRKSPTVPSPRMSQPKGRDPSSMLSRNNLWYAGGNSGKANGKDDVGSDLMMGCYDNPPWLRRTTSPRTIPGTFAPLMSVLNFKVNLILALWLPLNPNQIISFIGRVRGGGTYALEN